MVSDGWLLASRPAVSGADIFKKPVPTRAMDFSEFSEAELLCYKMVGLLAISVFIKRIVDTREIALLNLHV